MIKKIKQKISGAWNWIKAKAKWILLATLSIGAVYAAGEIIEQPPKTEIKQELKLKCDKSKILESKEVDWIEEVKDKNGKWTGEIINHGKIIKYDYITENKATGNFIWYKGKYTNARISTTKANTTDFFIGDHFAKADNGDIYEIEHGATTTIEAFKEQTKPDLISRIKNLFTAQAVTTSYYAGAGDGNCNAGSKDTWALARDVAASDTAAYTDTTHYINGGYTGTYHVGRLFFPVDTSAIPDGDVISSASFVVVVESTLGTADVGLIQTSQVSNTALEVGDFDALTLNTPDEGATRVAFNSTGSKTFTLNATGMGWISKTGFTKLGLRVDADITDTAPDENKGKEIRLSEYAGTASDPYLSVTYTVPAVAPIDSTQIIIWED